MHRATERIDGLRGSILPQKPVLAIVCQGCDDVAIQYANFFALGYKDGKLDPRFTVISDSSWAPQPVNVWQRKASIDDVVKRLSKADIIWPIKTDPWFVKAIASLVTDSSCLNALPDRAIIGGMRVGNSVRFLCIEK